MKSLRWTGPVLLAALAMGAAGPSSAAASAGFAAGNYPVTISGTQEGSAVFEFESGAKMKLTCTTATFTATLESASESTESLKVTPTYKSCKAFGFAATVTTTGCSYALHGGSETSSDEFSGSMDLSCETGKAITITLATVKCKVQIEGQSGLKSMKYVDNTASTPPNVTATASLSKAKYTVSEGAECGMTNGTKENGTLSQVDLMTATSGAANVALRVAEPTRLCDTNEVKCETGAGKVYAMNTALEFKSTSVLFKAGTLEITCTGSSLTGKVNDITGHPLLLATIETLTATPCVEKGTKNACTITSQLTPYPAAFEAIDGKGDGILGVFDTKIEVICNTAPFICDFGGTALFTFAGGKPATLELPAVLPAQLNHIASATEKNCTAKIEWSGIYSLNKPSPAFLTN